MSTTAAAPEWARRCQVPWSSWDARTPLEQYATQTISHQAQLAETPVPIDVNPLTVPCDGNWHHLANAPPAVPAARPKARVSASDSFINSVSARRAARRERDRREAFRTDEAARARGEQVDGSVVGSEAVWAARKERLHSLIADERAAPADLKRELRRLLSYADTVRTSAVTERAELAAELQQFIAPLLSEVARLRARVAEGGGASKDVRAKADEAPPAIQADAYVEDTLRSGRPTAPLAASGGGAATGAADGGGATGVAPPSAPPPPSTKAITRASAQRSAALQSRDATRAEGGGTDAAASAGGSGAVADVGAALSRRERQSIHRRVDGAIDSARRGASVEGLLTLLAEGGYAAAAAVSALDEVR